VRNGDTLNCVPGAARNAPGRTIFNVFNRGNARDEILGTDADFAAFEKVLAETQALVLVRILSYCLMPNHEHLVLWPLNDGELGRFMQRLTTTHVRRWHLDQTKELEAVRTSAVRGRPFGSDAWQAAMAKQLGLESTFRPRGRLRKAGQANRTQ